MQESGSGNPPTIRWVSDKARQFKNWQNMLISTKESILGLTPITVALSGADIHFGEGNKANFDDSKDARDTDDESTRENNEISDGDDVGSARQRYEAIKSSARWLKDDNVHGSCCSGEWLSKINVKVAERILSNLFRRS